jgi:hypothetical protein
MAGVRSWEGAQGYRLLLAYVRIELAMALPVQ